jgi:hypothetical protein
MQRPSCISDEIWLVIIFLSQLNEERNENIILILCQTIFSLPFLMEKAEIIMNFYLDIFGWHPL